METAYLSDVPLYTDGSDHLYNLCRDTNEMIWEAHNLTDDEKAYLSDQEDSLSTPYIYEYCGSYKSILSSTVILTIMISFLTVSLLFPQMSIPAERIRSSCAHASAGVRLSWRK